MNHTTVFFGSLDQLTEQDCPLLVTSIMNICESCFRFSTSPRSAQMQHPLGSTLFEACLPAQRAATSCGRWAEIAQHVQM